MYIFFLLYPIGLFQVSEEIFKFFPLRAESQEISFLIN